MSVNNGIEKMDTKNSDPTKEIDLTKLLTECLKKWWIFAITVIIATLVTYIGSNVFIAPTYQSIVQIVIKNKSSNNGFSSTDISAARALVNTSIVVLNAKDTIKTIIKEADLEDELSIGQVRQMIHASSVNNTEVLQVKVVSESPDDSFAIAMAIKDILPGIIDTKVVEASEGGVANVIESPELAVSPIGPNHIRNALIAAAAAFLITAGVICFIVFKDNTVRDDKDIQEITNIPILVHIPDLTEEFTAQSNYSV